jgi:hypothetical protein
MKPKRKIGRPTAQKLGRKVIQEMYELRKVAKSPEEFIEGYFESIKKHYPGFNYKIKSISKKFVEWNAGSDRPIGVKYDENINKFSALEVYLDAETTYDTSLYVQGFSETYFEGSHLFWCFGDMYPRFIHGRIPDYENYTNGDLCISEFTEKIYLFVEDFPEIYKARAKDVNLQKLQVEFDAKVKKYDQELQRAITDKKDTDKELNDIEDAIEKAKELLGTLEKVKSIRKAEIHNEVRVEHKKLKELPEITHELIETTRYAHLQKMEKLSQKPEYTDEFDELIKKTKEFTSLHVEHFI